MNWAQPILARGRAVGHARLFGFLLAAFGAVVALVAAGAIFVAWLGIYDVAASSGHSTLVGWFLHFTMRDSVAAHATRETPPQLDDRRLIISGAEHFLTECTPCHGSPETPPSRIALSMTPPPPPLYGAKRDFTPNELHWIVKHGIKMTAMPAWLAPQRDDEIWAMVAFLNQLPMTKDEFQALVGVDQSPLTAPFEQRKASPVRSASFINTCVRCHGSDGNGRGGIFPTLAGLGEIYIQNSLRAYREGARPSGFMQPLAKTLSDQDISEAASYFARLPRQQTMADKASDGSGARLANGTPNGGPSCVVCHSMEQSAVPNLTGQSKAYLADQLRLFRSGIRAGTHSARIMARYARGLSDDDIATLAASFSGLKPTISPPSQ